MAHADYVSKKVWDERYEWLRQVEEGSQNPLASYLLSSQGIFVAYDIEAAFCAGAWVSVIILAHAAIDATMRDTEALDYRSNSKVIFNDDSDLEWLRKTRNALVHVSESGQSKFLPEGEMNNIAEYHDSLREAAERSIRLLFKAIYASPGT